MDKNKTRLIIILSSVAIALGIAAVTFFNYNTWKEPLALNEKFILAWGNYDYTDFESYPDTIKPLVADSLYDEYFEGDENLQAQSIRLGRMITNEGRTTTTITKVSHKKVSNSDYVVETQIEESVTISGETDTQEKTVTITITKNGNEYFVSEIQYE